MVNSYCVTCKSKTSWAEVPRRHVMKNNVLMLKGRCDVCGKGKSTIAPQFKKKQPKKKPKKTKEYKSKRTGPTSVKLTRKKKGGFVGTAASLVAQGVYEGLNALAKSGLGGQGGQSAGNRARRARFGWPPTGRY